MKTYLISYNHYRPLGEKEELALFDDLQTINAPEFLGPDWSELGLKWPTDVVQSDLTASDIGARLIKYFGPNDKLLITEITQINNYWHGFLPEETAIRVFGRNSPPTRSDYGPLS